MSVGAGVVGCAAELGAGFCVAITGGVGGTGRGLGGVRCFLGTITGLGSGVTSLGGATSAGGCFLGSPSCTTIGDCSGGAVGGFNALGTAFKTNSISSA